MRIGLNTPNPQALSTDRASTSSGSTQPEVATHQADKFASDTVTLNSLTAKALHQPEIRQEKVDNLRQAVSSGEYKVDSQKIADAMIRD